MADDIDIEDLASQGYDYDDIRDAMLDAGYDADDISDAFAELDYDWEDALYDTIENQEVDRDYLDDHAHDWADALDMDVSDVYDLYYGYGDDAS